MRVSVYIVMFILFTNAGAAALQSTDAADTIGVDPAEGSDEQINAAKDAARSPDPGNGVGGTLFGLYNSIAGLLETIFNLIFPAAAMFKSTPIPDFAVNYAYTAMPIIVGLDVAAYFRGWSLL